MKCQNKPLMVVKENHYINVDAVISFLKESTHDNEWGFYEAIVDWDTPVLEEHQLRKDRMELFQERYLLTKHQLCMLRDGILKEEMLSKAYDALRREFAEHQADEGGKPLQLSCLFQIIREFAEPSPAAMNVTIVQGERGLSSFLSRLFGD